MFDLNSGAAGLRGAPVRPETAPSWFSAPLKARFVAAGGWIPRPAERAARVDHGRKGSQRRIGAGGSSLQA